MSSPCPCLGCTRAYKAGRLEGILEAEETVHAVMGRPSNLRTQIAEAMQKLRERK